jgi:hypothetical protein
MKTREKLISQFGGGMTEIRKSRSLKTRPIANQEKNTGKELEPKRELNNAKTLQRLVRQSISRPIATSDGSQKVEDDHLSTFVSCIGL